MTQAERITQLETRLVALEAQMHASPPANVQTINTGAPIRKLPFVKYGGKRCPTCSKRVDTGARGWYEPKVITPRGSTRAAIYCEPCGEARAKELGVAA